MVLVVMHVPAWFLIGKHVAGSELGLLTAARDADARLASIAAEALVGFDADVVHRFFVDEFGRTRLAGDPIRMLNTAHDTHRQALKVAFGMA